MEKKRCSFCNKKLKIIYFNCDCDGLFCDKHRLRQSHNCSITKDKKVLTQQNPQIIPKKLDKI
jgi:AN1-type zinc finger protein 5/6